MAGISSVLFIFDKTTVDLSVVTAKTRIYAQPRPRVYYNGIDVGCVTQLTQEEDGLYFEAEIDDVYLSEFDNKVLYPSPYVKIISRHWIGAQDILDAVYIDHVDIVDKSIYRQYDLLNIKIGGYTNEQHDQD